MLRANRFAAIAFPEIKSAADVYLVVKSTGSLFVRHRESRSLVSTGGELFTEILVKSERKKERGVHYFYISEAEVGK